MKKQSMLKVVNIVLALSFIFLVITALLHEQIDYAIYSKIHPLAGYLLTFMLCAHITLNWNWIKASYLKGKKKGD